MRIAVIDVGGTNMKSGIFQDGELVECREWDTQAKSGGAHVLGRMLEILEQYSDFQAVGISTAGQVNAKEGAIIYANDNIPGYTGIRIRDAIEARFHVPVAVDNDVNCAALGEAVHGAGAGDKDFLCLTYGTGVGGAIIMDHKVYCGADFSAAEFGGIVVHPEAREPEKDMFSGCYERYASTTALVRRAQEQFPEIGNGRDLFARIGEPEIRAILDQWILEITYGLATLIHIFNPSLIVLGGGIMEQSMILEGVKKGVRGQTMPSFHNVRIVQAKLGNKAGMLGAAENAKRIMA
ncbi:MAG: ROK family protein [Lachnospiraceae bacterium]|nr:ROK family protein [Lachnospiraceae bacterium]